jgi:hypothetical protein
MTAKITFGDIPMETTEEIFKHVDLTTLGNIRRSCSTYTLLSDALWVSQCLRLYSLEFWTRAKARPHHLSTPLESPMYELKRLVEWKALIYPDTWSESIFFEFWESQLVANIQLKAT